MGKSYSNMGIYGEHRRTDIGKYFPMMIFNVRHVNGDK
jgi:hypothetical protein